MTEREIFLAVLDLPDAADRSRYLDKVCNDPAQRARVNSLLSSHDNAGSFLGTPAVQPPETNGATQELGDAAPQARKDQTVSINGEGDDAMADNKKTAPGADADDLQFLSPSTRPDSLGRLGHYEMLQVLGRGGFGIVFRAFDDTLQRVVAIKVMAPQIATLSPARKRFVREAQSSAKVRHENVVQVYEVGEQPLPYLAMEFIPGETLQQKLDRNGPLDVSEVLRIGRQIAEGLSAAHACDLIHRDIKPGNVLLEGGSHKAKITDFGLARAADDASISQSGVIAGTPMFMAPEQALGHHIDHRADLFSLGSVLYQMASGRPPFRAPSALAVLKRVAEEPPRPITEIIPETPDWLCGIIAKLHAKNPDERFQSAREVADLLADCEAKLKAKQEVKNVLPAAAKPAGRKWVAAAAAVVLMLPVIALAVTEFAGVTHLFRQQATTDPIKPGGDQTPVVIAKKEAPTPVAKPEPLPPTFKNSIGMEFVIVPKGKSWLGEGKDKLGDKEVTLPADFYLGKYEVTQEEWTQVMGENPSHFSRTGGGKDAVKDISDPDLKRFPVESMTWDQCQIFVAKLNSLEKETGWVYRLPKEVEWEYACRGGPMSDKADSAFEFYFAKPTNTLLAEQANFKDSGPNRTCKVGSYKPNKLGLYDMHGNVWEFFDDIRQRPDGGHWSVRGGSWRANASDCQVRIIGYGPRRYQDDQRGLRLARVPSGAPSPEVKTPPIQVVTQGPTFKNSIGMEFVIVPKGKSWLGGGKDKLGAKEVIIPADFYLGKYEVTQEEWEKVMGENPSHFSRKGAGKDAVKEISDAYLKRFPVENVSRDQCRLFVTKLNEREKESGWAYRLPKEVEWEYACRGGPMADKRDGAFDYYFTKPTNTLLPKQANFVNGNSLRRTCKVGLYEPNSLGLYDMHGNVWEWCDDDFPPDPKAAADGPLRVYRGGSWAHAWDLSRVQTRNLGRGNLTYPTIGLRVARVPSGAPSPEEKTPTAAAPFTDADVKRIAALPAAEQLEEVRKELMRRNPSFDGKMGTKIEDGVVTEFKIVTDQVTDIAPIRVFNSLRVLDCSGTQGPNNLRANGQLADLTPLTGMNLAHLTQLHLRLTKVDDAGMAHFKDCKRLTELALYATQVSDVGLAYFHDCKQLKRLELAGTKVTDTGLAGFMDCTSLTVLYLSNLKVSDVGLTYFKDCKDLTTLFVGSNVTDTGLAHFKDCKKLTRLSIAGSKVTDLSLLKGMPLNELGCDIKSPGDADIVRSIKTLVKINGKPAAEFWQSYDTGEFTK